MKSLDRLMLLIGASVLMQACATNHPANTVAAKDMLGAQNPRPGQCSQKGC
jgi:hypothetical protein